MNADHITLRRPRTVSADQRREPAPPTELIRSRLGACLLGLYTFLHGPGAPACRRMLSRLIRYLEGGEMRSATLRRIMRQYHGIEIGAHSYGCFDPVRIPAGTRIARYVSVGPGVTAYRRNHPLDRLSLHPYFYNPHHGATTAADVATAPLVIEDDAWVGAHAIILPGCQRIGRSAVVAAGSVVTHDVPDYAIVAGNPARLLRYRIDTVAAAAADRSLWWQATPESVARRFDMSLSISGSTLLAPTGVTP